MVFRKLRVATAAIRQVARETRQASHDIQRGRLGQWSTKLSIGGLPEARREELLSSLEERLGVTRGPSEGDEQLHFRGTVTEPVSVKSACQIVLAQWIRLLDDLGIEGSELAIGPITLHVEPLEDAQAAGELEDLQTIKPDPQATPPGAGKRAVNTVVGEKRLARIAYGAALVVTRQLDRIERETVGSRNYEARLIVEADPLDEDAAYDERLLKQAAVYDTTPDDDGLLNFRIRAEGVGSAYGALVLCVARFGELLHEVPPDGAIIIQAATPRLHPVPGDGA